MSFFGFGKDTKNETTSVSNETLHYNWQDQSQTTAEGGMSVAAGAYASQQNTTVNNNMDADALNAAANLVGETINANASGQNAAYAMLGKFGRDAGELSYYTTKETLGANGAVVDIAANLAGKTATDALAAMNAAAAASVQAQAQSAREALAANNANVRDTFAYSTGVNTNLAKTYDSALGMVKSLSGLVVDAISDSGKKTQDYAAMAVDKVAGAWNNAKQAEKDLAGGDYRQLMIIGACIIGLVAIMGKRG